MAQSISHYCFRLSICCLDTTALRSSARYLRGIYSHQSELITNSLCSGKDYMIDANEAST